VELVVLFVILALLIFGPRAGGRRPSRIAMMAGALFLLWLLAAFGLGAIWNALLAPIQQP
jgi:hypothetical protein